MPYPLRIQYPALSGEQLRRISDRYGADPVVHRLLIEVRALQVIVRRAYQVAEAAGPGNRTDVFGIASAALHRELEAETWFQEELAARQAYRDRLAAGDVSEHHERAARRARKP